jgi:hypothetical protein
MRRLSLLAVAALGACAHSDGPGGAALTAGAARVDITPKAGARRAGGFTEVLSTGVHDPLHVRALVVGHGPTRIAIAVAEAVARADAARRPVRLETAVPSLPGLAFNRRFHMKDGTVRCNPGRGNPEIVRPAGPVDEDLPPVLFRDASSGVPVASLASFAMHTAVFGACEP